MSSLLVLEHEPNECDRCVLFTECDKTKEPCPLQHIHSKGEYDLPLSKEKMTKYIVVEGEQESPYDTYTITFTQEYPETETRSDE